MINLANVKSVYSGTNGMCCCGCAGKHTYKSGQTNDPYRIVNDKVVKRIINTMNKLIKEVGGEETDTEYVSIVNGNRLYIAYFNS